jgi:hypothetical protein
VCTDKLSARGSMSGPSAPIPVLSALYLATKLTYFGVFNGNMDRQALCCSHMGSPTANNQGNSLGGALD